MNGIEEEFKDIKGVIRIRISKNNRQHSGQKDKQRSTSGTYPWSFVTQILHLDTEIYIFLIKTSKYNNASKF